MHAALSLLLLLASLVGFHARPAALPPSPVNLAPKAKAVASFTASNGMLLALNDGRLPATSSAMEAWHTWGARTDPVSVGLEWSAPVVLNALEVMWWYDQTEAARGGVQRPLEARVEYWTGSAWAPVAGLTDASGAPVSGVGLEGSGTAQRNTVFNGVRFTPVTTTQLRLVLKQNRAAEAGTATGIGELRVFSEDPASIVFSDVAFVDPQWTTRDLKLPGEVAGYAIRWSSDRPDVLSGEGVVRRGAGAQDVVLTANATRAGEAALTRRYAFRVLPSGSAGRTLELDLDKLGITISPSLYGLFFEDICHALDGGLNANLVDNGSFQQYNWPTALPATVSNRGPNDDRYSLDPREIYSWTTVARGGAAGSAQTVGTHPLSEHNTYAAEVQITAASGTDAAYGIAANGYAKQAANTRVASLPIEQGVSYDMSAYLQAERYAGRVRAWLENEQGERNSNVLELAKATSSWKSSGGRLTALRTEDSRLVIAGDRPGTFRIDYVVLKAEPSRLWRNGAAGGLRKDMAEAMEAIHPRFLRFPGGCASEGKSQDRLYNWKHTVGPREARRQMPNYWGYWSSNEIGFYEYFLLAEALGADALPVVGLGMTCPFHRHPGYYEAPLDSAGCDACTEKYSAMYVQDALDLIEFANGDVNTKWGRLRAQMGHPKPFNLKYISLGNENWGESFWKRFDIMYAAVRKAHPEITVVSTAGPYASGRQLNENYRHIDAKYAETIVDEHYYMASAWFLANTHRYDSTSVRGDQNNRYDRSKPTRVFVGEYADAGGRNHFMSALYEAAFTTGLERNSDLVVMASYAPLFCKKGMTNWDSNLMWFDDRGLWRTPNYWYQWIFSNHVGDRAVPARFATFDDPAARADVLTAPSIDTKTGAVYLKIVNPDAQAKEIRITLRGAGAVERKASYVRIQSDDLMARNHNSPDHSELIQPRTEELGTVRDHVILTVPGQSVGALVLRSVARP